MRIFAPTNQKTFNMPHIDITMYPGRSREIKSRLAEKIQQTIVEELKVDKGAISVSIEDVPKEQWTEHLKKYEGENLYIKPE
jgi:4-oxalocrotonate tautomerase